MDAAAARHPEVSYEPQLIDATFALLLASAGDPLVIPALNRDGDILSDFVLPLFGSIAGSESLVVAFGDDYAPRAIMAEAAHGTAPAPLRQERRQPARDDPRRRGAAHPHGERGAHGRRPSDSRGEPRGGRCRHAHGRPRRSRGHDHEFTDAVIERVRQKLEVWSSLADV